MSTHFYEWKRLPMGQSMLFLQVELAKGPTCLACTTQLLKLNRNLEARRLPGKVGSGVDSRSHSSTSVAFSQ